MRIHDISAPLRADLPHWPDEQGLVRRVTSDLTKGDEATVSFLELGLTPVHTSTRPNTSLQMERASRHFHWMCSPESYSSWIP
jgi:hypothetical protein